MRKNPSTGGWVVKAKGGTVQQRKSSTAATMRLSDKSTDYVQVNCLFSVQFSLS